MFTCIDCNSRATHYVTVLIDDNEGYVGDARFVTHPNCTGCAADAAEELAHGEPAGVQLVSVVAITPASEEQYS